MSNYSIEYTCQGNERYSSTEENANRKHCKQICIHEPVVKCVLLFPKPWLLALINLALEMSKPGRSVAVQEIRRIHHIECGRETCLLNHKINKKATIITDVELT